MVIRERAFALDMRLVWRLVVLGASCWKVSQRRTQCHMPKDAELLVQLHSQSCDPFPAGCHTEWFSTLLGAPSGAAVQVRWEGAFKRLCDLLQLPLHGDTSAFLPETNLKIWAVPEILETGVIQEEAHAGIHLSWSNIKE